MDESDAATPPRDPLASEARVVEWYRVDIARRMLAVLVPSAALLLAGSLLASHAFVIGDLPTSSAMLGVGGLLLVIVGPLAAIIGLRRLLTAEDYLIVRTDGVLHHVGDRQMHVRWEDLEAVRWEPESDGIELRGGGERFVVHERFSGIRNRALAERLEEVRRKAIHDLLPQQRGRG